MMIDSDLMELLASIKKDLSSLLDRVLSEETKVKLFQVAPRLVSGLTPYVENLLMSMVDPATLLLEVDGFIDANFSELSGFNLSTIVLIGEAMLANEPSPRIDEWVTLKVLNLAARIINPTIDFLHDDNINVWYIDKVGDEFRVMVYNPKDDTMNVSEMCPTLSGARQAAMLNIYTYQLLMVSTNNESEAIPLFIDYLFGDDYPIEDTLTALCQGGDPYPALVMHANPACVRKIAKALHDDIDVEQAEERAVEHFLREHSPDMFLFG